ncbi:mitotic-spindle organizing protein 2A [Trichonephila clavipes]|nr:mitotic-spindle organizing protein 2A [Trichonephila clavipes]
MACERKLLESEATTGFFVLLGTKGKKGTLEWCMKANLIASRYECPRCKNEMRLQKRKGTVDGYEWRCRSQSKDNPHDVVRSVRKGTWFSESKLAITIILRLTRYWFGKSMNAFVVNDFHEFRPMEHDEMQADKAKRFSTLPLEGHRILLRRRISEYGVSI